jgi:hypothetical protein
MILVNGMDYEISIYVILFIPNFKVICRYLLYSTENVKEINLQHQRRTVMTSSLLLLHCFLYLLLLYIVVISEQSICVEVHTQLCTQDACTAFNRT